MVDQTSLFQEVPQGLQCYPNLLVFVVEDPDPFFGHSAFGNRDNLGASVILTWLFAETASCVSPAIPRSLEIVSKYFAAAVFEAEAPCSVNTAVYPSWTLTPSRNGLVFHLPALDG